LYFLYTDLYHDAIILQKRYASQPNFVGT
jgi:hypothetical protein